MMKTISEQIDELAKKTHDPEYYKLKYMEHKESMKMLQLLLTIPFPSPWEDEYYEEQR